MQVRDGKVCFKSTENMVAHGLDTGTIAFYVSLYESVRRL